MEQKDYRLAAIIYTDIAGFSKMMEKNEARTLELLHHHNALIEECVSCKGGTVIKTIGDAFLIDFRNTVDALQCAMDIQYKLYEYNKENRDLPLLVRIGLHLGDIYFYENDALGEGINIAARLQSVAHPGCIAMSHHVYNMVLNKVDFKAEELGQVSLKNITKEIRVYEIATPNVEFDPGRNERTILKPAELERKAQEKLEKAAAVVATPAPAVAGAVPASEREDLRKRALLAVKAEGRRLREHEMLARLGRSDELAREVVADFVAKGIVLRSDPEDFAKAAPAPSGGGEDELTEFGKSLATLGSRIEREIKRGLESARSEHHEYKHAYKEERREARREARVQFRAVGLSDLEKLAEEGERLSDMYEESRKDRDLDRWEAKLKDTPFSSKADSLSNSEDYERRIRRESAGAKAGFIGNLASFVGVNALLMHINLRGGGFPWALVVFGGWGIGLLQHFAAILRRTERVREFSRLPPLNEQQLGLFKQLQRKKDAFWHHFSSNLSTSVFLLMLNAITSPQFPWAVIATVGMGIGLISHAGTYAAKKRELEKQLMDSFGLSGSWSRAVKRMPATAQTDYSDVGPYRAIVEEAQAVRAAIVAQVNLAARKGRGRKDVLPVDRDFLPTLDSYVEQVALMARRAHEVDHIVELIPVEALSADKAALVQKKEQAQGVGLKKEYDKSLAEIARQEKSFAELEEQREMLQLRMKSSVNTLKQMRIDLARLSGMDAHDTAAATTVVVQKTAELNRYLDDLKAGYDELGLLDPPSENV